MTSAITSRQIRLERESNVSAIEASALKLEVGETIEKSIKDIQAYQTIRTRFNRLKRSTGRIYETSMSGNKIIITRMEDECNT